MPKKSFMKSGCAAPAPTTGATTPCPSSPPPLPPGAADGSAGESTSIRRARPLTGAAAAAAVPAAVVAGGLPPPRPEEAACLRRSPQGCGWGRAVRPAGERKPANADRGRSRVAVLRVVAAVAARAGAAAEARAASRLVLMMRRERQRAAVAVLLLSCCCWGGARRRRAGRPHTIGLGGGGEFFKGWRMSKPRKGWGGKGHSVCCGVPVFSCVDTVGRWRPRAPPLLLLLSLLLRCKPKNSNK